MDAFQTWPPDDNGETLSLIRRRAKRLLRQTHLPATELDEVEQLLTVELWQSSRSFNKDDQQWPAHARTVLKQSAGRFVRHRCAMKRDPRRCQSLNVDVQEPSGEQTELAAAIPTDEVRKHRCIYSEAPELAVDARHDAPRIVSRLPVEWREPISMLSAYSQSEVAIKTGVKRTTLVSRLNNVRRRYPDYFQI